MTCELQLTNDEADLVVSALAERAVNEISAGRDKRAHAALDFAEKVQRTA